MTIDNEDAFKLEIVKNVRNALSGYHTPLEITAYRDSLIACVVLLELRTWLGERSSAFEVNKEFNDAIDTAVDFCETQVKLNKVLFEEHNKKYR